MFNENGAQEIPLFFDYVDEDMKTGYVGEMDQIQSLEIPYSQLTSYFFHTKIIASDGILDTNSGTFLISNNPTMFFNEGIKVYNLPFREITGYKEFENASKEKCRYAEIEEKFYKEYLVPSLDNVYTGLGADGKNVYMGKINDDSDIYPAVHSYMLDNNLNSSMIQNQNLSYTRHITNDPSTKGFLRNHPEYKNRNIVEYIIMSFGDEERVDIGGKVHKLTAKNNIRLVPVMFNFGITYNDNFSEKERLEVIRKSLSIDEAFMTGNRDNISKNKLSAINFANNKHTEENKENVDDIKKVYEEVKDNKKDKVNAGR